MASQVLSIDKIRIRNFRSIIDQTIELARFSVFVGNNDQGKSNILKALNLFFNETSSGTRRHTFEEDFNLYSHKEGSHKAKEIIIELWITPPLSYQEGRQVYWRRVWRTEGIQRDKEIMRYADGSVFPARSKMPALLNSIRYEYVPAIKGNEYFSRLLGDLHDILALTAEGEMRSASTGFTDSINTHACGILDELKLILEFDSTIQLPPDLRDLFAQLDFASEQEGKRISFIQRGDGVKVRHVPAILYYIAQQANQKRAQGRPTVFTVWGYEEPENNLEMSKSLELADRFIKYSNRLQILVTTHSPSFYSIARSAKWQSRLHTVRLLEEPKRTEVVLVPHESIAGIDEQMGLCFAPVGIGQRLQIG